LRIGRELGSVPQDLHHFAAEILHVLQGLHGSARGLAQHHADRPDQVLAGEPDDRVERHGRFGRTLAGFDFCFDHFVLPAQSCRSRTPFPFANAQGCQRWVKPRDKILPAARVLSNERGVSTLSALDIATAMGISPGHLYYHFKGKPEIVTTLLAEHETEVGL